MKEDMADVGHEPHDAAYGTLAPHVPHVASTTAPATRMRYVRFLKAPRIVVAKGSARAHVHCLVTVTSDLGDSFLPEAVELAAELLASNDSDRLDVCVWRTVAWTPGLRTLAIELPLKKAYAAAPLRVRVGVEPGAQHDTFEALCQKDAHGVVSAWSAEFNVGGREAVKLVERRFLIASQRVGVWEETGESIARHLWDAGITLAHHLSTLLTPTSPLSTALALPAHPLTILELGTGCGIVGLALAALLPNSHTTLTDLPEASEIVALNLSHAQSTLAPGASVRFLELDWDAPLPTLESDRPLDLVLAADCTYNPDTSPALVRTLTSLAQSAPRVVVAVAMKVRHASESVFFDLMREAGFVHVEVLKYELPGDGRVGEEVVDVHVYRLGNA